MSCIQLAYASLMMSVVTRQLPILFKLVEGTVGLRNDLICVKPRAVECVCQGHVVYFGGDIQNLKKEMKGDSKEFIQWNLEDTATLLSKRFPDHLITIVRPSVFAHMFSIYKNFVSSKDDGSPRTFDPTFGAINHLQQLLENLVHKQLNDVVNGDVVDKKDLNMELINSDCDAAGQNCCATETQLCRELPLILIGFSKGGVVLNQLLYELHAISSNKITISPETSSFVKRIKAMYWLDPGHNGRKTVFVTDEKILHSFAERDIEVFVHMTPYQNNDRLRPWKRHEKEAFLEHLRNFGAKTFEKLHFADQKADSLENHFRVLEEF